MAIEITKMINDAIEYLSYRGVEKADIGIILGSGLNDFVEKIENAISIPYSKIPGFITTRVDGHKGELIYGDYAGKKVIALAGRFHYYEGYEMQHITLPTRVMIKCGIKRIIITNASGLVNLDWNECELMMMSDHINLSGSNPLIGPNLDEFGTRFPDMSDIYSKELRKRIIARAAEQGINLREGVYTMMSGPSFETPAEIRFLRTIGTDAVGMSSVPEAIIARHAGIEVVGISFLSNWAAGVVQDKELNGQEVTDNGLKVKEMFEKVIYIAITE